MSDPTNLIQPYTSSSDQLAKLELDEDNSTLAPGEYIYWLAHIPPGSSLVTPFYSNDGGSMELLTTTVTLERSQAGLVLDDSNRSINLDYYPTGTPTVISFGNVLQPDTSKLLSGLLVPEGSYDGKTIYEFNIYYQVEFYRIRHRPSHPELIAEELGGQFWEDYKGDGDLKTFPINVQAFWE